jgi:hypothetical protein
MVWMHREGLINGLEAQGEPHKRFGCIGKALQTVWMHRKGPINSLDS